MDLRIARPVSTGRALPAVQADDSFSGGYEGDYEATRTLVVPYDGSDSWRAYVPAVGDLHPADSRVRYLSYEAEQVAATQLKIVLSYAVNIGSAADDDVNEDPDESTEIPDDEVIEDGATVTADITRHPNFESVLRPFYNPYERRIWFAATVPDVYLDSDGVRKRPSNAGATVPANLRGVDSFLVGTGTVTVVQYYRNRPSGVIEESGTLSTPNGYSGANKWIVLSGTRSKVGVFWQKRLTYQYSSTELSGDIYS